MLYFVFYSMNILMKEHVHLHGDKPKSLCCHMFREGTYKMHIEVSFAVIWKWCLLRPVWLYMYIIWGPKTGLQVWVTSTSVVEVVSDRVAGTEIESLKVGPTRWTGVVVLGRLWAPQVVMFCRARSAMALGAAIIELTHYQSYKIYLAHIH